MKKGTLYTTPTSLEIELSKLIIKNFPSIQKVRTVNTGAEATMTAIRLARGFTKKKKIIKFEGFIMVHMIPFWLKRVLDLHIMEYQYLMVV